MENQSAADRNSGVPRMILESPWDDVLQEDLELLAQDDSIPFGLLKGKTVFVTGATGLLGSQIVKTLL